MRRIRRILNDNLRPFVSCVRRSRLLAVLTILACRALVQVEDVDADADADADVAVVVRLLPRRAPLGRSSPRQAPRQAISRGRRLTPRTQSLLRRDRLHCPFKRFVLRWWTFPRAPALDRRMFLPRMVQIPPRVSPRSTVTSLRWICRALDRRFRATMLCRIPLVITTIPLRIKTWIPTPVRAVALLIPPRFPSLQSPPSHQSPPGSLSCSGALRH